MRNVRFYLAIFMVGMLVFQSCSGSKTTGRKLRTGDYTFYMSDSVGNPLVEGTMILDTAKGGKLTGTYQITNKYVENFAGFRTMQGIYEGSFDRTVHGFSINMNPKLADANIFIKGKYTSTYLVGTWVYSTYVGIMKSGGFRAELQE